MYARLLSRLKRVLEKLGEQKDKVQILFITFDPNRDTSTHLKEYLSSFNKDFIGLTGSEKEIQSVAKSFKAIYFRDPQKKKNNNYTISHTDYIYLIGPKGNTRAYYRRDIPVGKIVKDIRSVLR